MTHTYNNALKFLTEHGYLTYDGINELLAYIYNKDIREVIADIQLKLDPNKEYFSLK